MRSWVVLAVIGSLCAFAQPECSLEGGNFSVPFPKIENEAYGSFEMSVELTLPVARETYYYTEYYDIFNRRGRVDDHHIGKASTYIYNAPTYEAWEISGRTCQLLFLNDTPILFKDYINDWLYMLYQEGKAKLITIGPSAMFKIADDASKDNKVAFMGDYPNEVRGIKGIYWRRCDGEKSYVDYVFTGDKYENPYGLKDLKTLPLRVFFGGERPYQDPYFARVQYDIVQFQPFISEGLRPFDLPRGCKRRKFHDGIPKPSEFLKKMWQQRALAPK